MFLEIAFTIVFAISGYYFVQYLDTRAVQHDITNNLLSELINALHNNNEESKMSNEEEL